MNPKNGTIITEKQSKQKEEQSEKNNLYVTDSSKLNDYTCFDVKLPAYLPDGYTFKNADVIVRSGDSYVVGIAIAI
ncbi:hypothetical protein [Clostridium uliginosum]|uniref:Uncharacterized protein n=1 Tax=Clostridium uliginosum TaxID=119641 RepID=A0A1I1P0S6_9CLOT|nr:hypothetical protein [Clostridium uliginosum]SFD03521.1 hypothetical protein SAMN05421842_11791 [Clostridium uliginosum]